jgi:dienelactone hydrolase
VLARTQLLTLAVCAALAGMPAGAQTSDQRARTRADFLRLIDRPRVPAAPAISALPRVGPFEQERFEFASEANERVPGLIVKPAGTARRATVIVLHGTGGQKEDMVPLLASLAERGFLAVAIDGRFHGERGVGAFDYDDAILRAYRTGKGHPFLFDTVWDVLRLVDYLGTRPDVDPARVGLMGISKGGMETYLAAAVDTRIAAAVPVIGVQSFKWALDHDAWQARVGTFSRAFSGVARDENLGRPTAATARRFYDRVTPGIYDEFDGPQMLPLIAPRPLLVINGDRDRLTPLPGVQACLSAAQDAYRQADEPHRFSVFLQPMTAHEFKPGAQRLAFEWLVEWLKPTG